MLRALLLNPYHRLKRGHESSRDHKFHDFASSLSVAKLTFYLKGAFWMKISSVAINFSCKTKCIRQQSIRNYMVGSSDENLASIDGSSMSKCPWWLPWTSMHLLILIPWELEYHFSRLNINKSFSVWAISWSLSICKTIKNKYEKQHSEWFLAIRK